MLRVEFSYVRVSCRLLALLFITLATLNLQAQTFSELYDFSIQDIPKDILVDEDKILLLSLSVDAPAFYYTLRVLDFDGNSSAIYGYTKPSVIFTPNEVLGLTDSTCMVLGTQALGSSSNYFSSIIDTETGNLLTETVYTDIDDGCALEGAVRVGDFIYLAGWARGFSSFSESAYLKKIGTDGVEYWSKPLLVPANNTGSDITNINDSLYVLAQVRRAGDLLASIFVLDTSGAEIDYVEFPAYPDFYPNDLYYSSDQQRFFIAGSRDHKGVLLILNKDLSLATYEEYPLGAYCSFGNIGENPAGEFVVSGHGNDTANGINYNVKVLLIDQADYSIINDNWYSPSGIQDDSTFEFNAGLDISASHIYVASSTSIGPEGNAADWVLALELNGDTIISGLENPGDDAFREIVFYPNPANDQITFELGGQVDGQIGELLQGTDLNKLELSIYSSFGLLCKRVKIKRSKNTINTAALTSGLYFISLSKDGKNIGSAKLVVEH